MSGECIWRRCSICWDSQQGTGDLLVSLPWPLLAHMHNTHFKVRFSSWPDIIFHFIWSVNSPMGYQTITKCSEAICIHSKPYICKWKIYSTYCLLVMHWLFLLYFLLLLVLAWGLDVGWNHNVHWVISCWLICKTGCCKIKVMEGSMHTAVLRNILGLYHVNA